MHKLGLWMQLVEKIPSLEANRRFKHLASKIRILNLMHELRNRKLQKSKIIFYSFFFSNYIFLYSINSRIRSTNDSSIRFFIKLQEYIEKHDRFPDINKENELIMWSFILINRFMINNHNTDANRRFLFLSYSSFQIFLFQGFFFSYFTFLHFLTLLKPYG